MQVIWDSIHVCTTELLTFRQWILDVGDVVWISLPTGRPPGQYKIVEAHPDDYFSLESVNTGTPYPDQVKGSCLIRDFDD